MRSLFDSWRRDSAGFIVIAWAEDPPSKMNNAVTIGCVHLGQAHDGCAGPPTASWKLRLRLGELCLWWPVPDISQISLAVHYPQVSVQIDQEYEIPTCPSCFILSPEALSCVTGWGTQPGDEPLSNEEWEAEKIRKCRRKISICLEILVHPKHECQRCLTCSPRGRIPKWEPKRTAYKVLRLFCIKLAWGESCYLWLAVPTAAINF